jgi:hypothetical protein
LGIYKRGYSAEDGRTILSNEADEDAGIEVCESGAATDGCGETDCVYGGVLERSDKEREVLLMVRK